MRIEDMECFRVLAETLSYTNAANRLYLTQSSLTRTIQQMEEELGFQLFDRSRRSVSLTSAGQSFYQSCEAVLAEYYNSVDKARHARDGSSGVIRFAAHSFFVNSVVYEIIEGFQHQYPEITLQISSSGSEEMIHQLKEGSIDCAVCTARPADRSIERITLKKYRECLVVSPQHLLAEKEEVSFEVLKEERFAVISRTVAGRGYDGVKERARAAGFDPYVEEAADSVPHLMACVATGRYVTLLSENYQRLATGRLKFIPLVDETTVELAFLWNKNSANPCVKICADYVKANFKRKIGDSI